MTCQIAPQREERGGQRKATQQRSWLVLSLVYDEASELSRSLEVTSTLKTLLFLSGLAEWPVGFMRGCQARIAGRVENCCRIGQRIRKLLFRKCLSFSSSIACCYGDCNINSPQQRLSIHSRINIATAHNTAHTLASKSLGVS